MCPVLGCYALLMGCTAAYDDISLQLTRLKFRRIMTGA